MAYHTLVRAIEAARMPRSPSEAFADAIRHAVDGQLPLSRLHRAAGQIGPRRLGEGAIDRLLVDLIAIDLNPFTRRLAKATNALAAIRMHRHYNARTDVAVLTEGRIGPGGKFEIASRHAPEAVDDPALCVDFHCAAMNLIFQMVDRRGPRGSAPPAGLADVADKLGAPNLAARDAAAYFDSEPHGSVEGLARRLGCSPRTLQRQLRRARVEASEIKRAAMLSHATNLLDTDATATAIAHDSGYADQAHMCRAFVKACGLTPTMLRHQQASSDIPTPA